LTALLIASVSFGCSALLIRFAIEVSVISLTFFRLLIAACVMLIFAVATSQLHRLDRRGLVLVIVSGIFLSLHFTAFIFAVKGTTIANATFLVNTSPVMLAVLSPMLIKERTTPREVLAVLVAMVGVLLVAYAGNGFRLFGLADVSALLAAFFLTVYSLAGRHLRTGGISTACYTSYVYSTAALVALLMVALLGSNTFHPYNTQNLVAIFVLALVPTALGHSLYNYSLGSVKAVTANLFPLMEPIIASALAVPLFGEVPTVTQIAGYALILVAVVIVATNLK
jgi:drug/metabolite transporter (DMT)-like permease